MGELSPGKRLPPEWAHSFKLSWLHPWLPELLPFLAKVFAFVHFTLENVNLILILEKYL